MQRYLLIPENMYVIEIKRLIIVNINMTIFGLIVDFFSSCDAKSTNIEQVICRK